VKSGFTSPVHQKQVYRGPQLNGKPALFFVTSVYTYRRIALPREKEIFVGCYAIESAKKMVIDMRASREAASL